MATKDHFKFGGVSIDVIELASRGTAVLGIRDSGKTFTATALAEHLMDSGVPIVVFDPTGVWPSLRIPGKGKGYPVVVVGGEFADLPITVADAPKYLRAAMAAGVSIVFDMLDIKLSKADWKRIVTECVRILIHENKQYGLRHVFIEEAAEFVPQRVGRDQGQVYAEMEKLARIGGNSRLGFTIVNQRAEEVNKAVLELCDNLFLHRQKGRLSLTALRKWLDIGNVDGEKMMASMADLPSGECWTWLKDGGAPTRIKVPMKNSAHPDRRAVMSGDTVKARKTVDVSEFVTNMKARMSIAAKPAGKPSPAKPVNLRTASDPQDVSVREAKALAKAEYDRGFADGEYAAALRHHGDLEKLRAQAAAALGAMDHLFDKALIRLGSQAKAPSLAKPHQDAGGESAARPRQPKGPIVTGRSAGTKSGPLQTLIDAIAAVPGRRHRASSDRTRQRDPTSARPRRRATPADRAARAGCRPSRMWPTTCIRIAFIID